MWSGGRRKRGCRRRRDGCGRKINTKNDMLHEIRDRMKDLLATLSEDEVRDLLLQVVEQEPGLMLDLLKTLISNQSGGYHHRPPPEDQCPGWCICGNCREMPTELEKVCCGQTPNNCMSGSPDFGLYVLNKRVFPIARAHRRDVFLDEKKMEANRQAAYRKFTLWRHGKLGAGIRRVIPSCCVWKIRDEFPDPFKHYTGFVPSRWE